MKIGFANETRSGLNKTGPYGRLTDNKGQVVNFKNTLIMIAHYLSRRRGISFTGFETQPIP